MSVQVATTTSERPLDAGDRLQSDFSLEFFRSRAMEPGGRGRQWEYHGKAMEIGEHNLETVKESWQKYCRQNGFA